MTTCMRHQLTEMAVDGKSSGAVDMSRHVTSRRETFMGGPLDESSHDDLFDRSSDVDEPSPYTPVQDSFEADPTFLQTNGKLPLWARKLISQDKDKNEPLVVVSQNQYRPQGRWAQSDSTVLIRNFLDSNDLTYCGTPNYDEEQSSFLDETTDIEPKCLQELLESEDGNDFLDNRTLITEASSALEETDLQSQSSESNGICYPSSLQTSQQEESDFSIEERTFDKGNEAHINGLLAIGDPDEDSQFSDNCSEAELDDNDVEENVRPETPEQERFLRKHFDTLADALAEEKFDNTLKDLKPDDEELNPRLSFSSKFLSRSNRTVCDLLPGGQQMATAFSTELKVESDRSQRRLSDKQAEKAPDRMERRKSAEILKSSASLQKLPQNEKSSSSSRSSFPGCWPNKSKSNKARSYMEATASFKAKIFRSVSMGENLNCPHTEEHRRPAHLSRPLSTIDLSSLEQNKLPPGEDNSYKPLLISTSCEQIPSTTSSDQERGKPSVIFSNPLSDKLLMPPPSTCGVMPRLKKAKSVNNLSKTSKKEELNSVKPKCGDVPKNGPAIEKQKWRSPSSSCRSPEVHDLPRRASIAEFPNHVSVSVCTSSQVMEEPQSSRSNVSSSQVTSCRSPGDPDVTVLASRCEQVVEELHLAFQKTLQTYKEIEHYSGPQEEKSHLSYLFLEAFDHIQSEIDLVKVGQKNSSVRERSPSNPTLRLLERYSDMMLQLMREKINGQ